jgi:hypothetical protein
MKYSPAAAGQNAGKPAIISQNPGKKRLQGVLAPHDVVHGIYNSAFKKLTLVSSELGLMLCTKYLGYAYKINM